VRELLVSVVLVILMSECSAAAAPAHDLDEETLGLAVNTHCRSRRLA
jgi:hypothetical protein